jgi:hypothetical protein
MLPFIDQPLLPCPLFHVKRSRGSTPVLGVGDQDAKCLRMLVRIAAPVMGTRHQHQSGWRLPEGFAASTPPDWQQRPRRQHLDPGANIITVDRLRLLHRKYPHEIRPAPLHTVYMFQLQKMHRRVRQSYDVELAPGRSLDSRDRVKTQPQTWTQTAVRNSVGAPGQVSTHPHQCCMRSWTRSLSTESTSYPQTVGFGIHRVIHSTYPRIGLG